MGRWCATLPCNTRPCRRARSTWRSTRWATPRRNFPELSIVTLPGIPANAEVAGLLKGTEFEEQLQIICEEKGFRILTWWWLDGGMASRTRAVTGPETIKDLGARSGGGNDFNAMLQGAGARIVTMPLSEVRAAIETGKLDVAQKLVRDVRQLSLPRDRQACDGRRLQHADGVHPGPRSPRPPGTASRRRRGGRWRRLRRRPTSTSRPASARRRRLPSRPSPRPA